jgi:hypothetical protein
MSKAKNASQKPKKSTKSATAPKPKVRKLKKQQYKSFRLSKRIRYEGPNLPSAIQLARRSVQLFWQHKILFGGVLLVYGLLQLLLVQGVVKTDFSQVKQATDDLFGSQWHGVAGGLTAFSYLLSSIGQTNSSESTIYQTVLFIISSLAFIWMLRQAIAGHVIRIRDAYYKGMYPLVPFILVLTVITLQLIPLLIGAWLYTVVTANGIAVSTVEHVFWLLIFALFSLLSAYMICSSLFALYVVTLPDMTPMKALRSARGLVLHRRWMVGRKLLFLALIVVIVFSIIMLPVIIVLPVIVPVVFYILSVLAVGFVHVYIYTLYRELLRDE